MSNVAQKSRAVRNAAARATVEALKVAAHVPAIAAPVTVDHAAEVARATVNHIHAKKSEKGLINTLCDKITAARPHMSDDEIKNIMRRAAVMDLCSCTSEQAEAALAAKPREEATVAAVNYVKSSMSRAFTMLKNEAETGDRGKAREAVRTPKPEVATSQVTPLSEVIIPTADDVDGVEAMVNEVRAMLDRIAKKNAKVIKGDKGAAIRDGIAAALKALTF